MNHKQKHSHRHTVRTCMHTHSFNIKILYSTLCLHSLFTSFLPF